MRVLEYSPHMTFVSIFEIIHVHNEFSTWHTGNVQCFNYLKHYLCFIHEYYTRALYNVDLLYILNIYPSSTCFLFGVFLWEVGKIKNNC